MKILDCTLRDGGYYTNWDFNRKLVDTYIKACNDLPLDYLEVGYRSIPLSGYYGEYFYLPLYVMERLKTESNKKLVVILNEKDIRPENLQEVLGPCIGLIDMVRLAIDPKEFGRALTLAAAVKSMGFEVGFNVMYMSKWKDQMDFLKLLPEVNGIADYFYMVDSYGGVYPNDVKETIQLVRGYNEHVPLGFHGHNNLEMALINTLTAIDEGCDIVDATITGMGRGAGNVKTELLLTALNAQEKLEVDFNPLSNVVDAFSELQKTYEWGTNLPYMVSGAHSLPQKDVMDWVGKRFYSYNSIIRALQNQAKGINDNLKLPKFENKNYKRAILVGGGPAVKEIEIALQYFLKNNPDTAIIHASSKNALTFVHLKNPQLFCLVGNEGQRLEETLQHYIPSNIQCVLPPFPRKMGTYIPNVLKDKSFEVSQIRFEENISQNVTALALEIACLNSVDELFVVGYDGYGESVSENEFELFNENEELFRLSHPFDLISLTKTKYKNLIVGSIFSQVK
jgi:4-hydroxy 2-oxovalerate aldolase